MRYNFAMRCVLVTLLIGSILGNATAGLDDPCCIDEVVSVYYFEKNRVKITDQGRFPQTDDSGPRGNHAVLETGARMTDDGKFGKGLQLSAEGEIYAALNDELRLSREFSIVAWVKIPQQEDAFNLGMIAFTEQREGAGAAVLKVLSDGDIYGVYTSFQWIGDVPLDSTVESQGSNVTDGEWHHIAFTKYANDLSLYIDGELVAQEVDLLRISFSGALTFIYLKPQPDSQITDQIVIDDSGFFGTGFSIYEIQALYNHQQGLEGFLTAMPVNPQDNSVTTWGDIKARR